MNTTESRGHRNLHRMRDIRGGLADVIRALENSSEWMNCEKARTLGYLYNLLGNRIKERELEALAKRLDRIEKEQSGVDDGARARPYASVPTEELIKSVTGNSDTFPSVASRERECQLGQSLK